MEEASFIQHSNCEIYPCVEYTSGLVHFSYFTVWKYYILFGCFNFFGYYKVLWAFVHKSLCRHIPSFPLGTYRVGCQHHGVGTCGDFTFPPAVRCSTSTLTTPGMVSHFYGMVVAVVLMGVSLMTKNADAFLGLPAICVSSLVKFLFKSSAYSRLLHTVCMVYIFPIIYFQPASLYLKYASCRCIYYRLLSYKWLPKHETIISQFLWVRNVGMH